MKHTTLLAIYRTVLHDPTISHNDFVKIVDYLKRFNGKIDSFTKELQERSIIIRTGKRGRPVGSKNKTIVEQKINHLTVKEPWETTKEFKQRQKEENGE